MLTARRNLIVLGVMIVALIGLTAYSGPLSVEAEARWPMEVRYQQTLQLGPPGQMVTTVHSFEGRGWNDWEDTVVSTTAPETVPEGFQRRHLPSGETWVLVPGFADEPFIESTGPEGAELAPGPLLNLRHLRGMSGIATSDEGDQRSQAVLEEALRVLPERARPPASAAVSERRVRCDSVFPVERCRGRDRVAVKWELAWQEGTDLPLLFRETVEGEMTQSLQVLDISVRSQ
jgi:hypothetical protein